MIYDCIVVGKGLIGSAAAKYLGSLEQSVVVIGPDEPDDIHKAVVYASHYDQARVQRIIGTDEVSTLLNLQSVNAYENIEKESNIFFHSKSGCLYVNPYGTDTYLNDAESLAAKYNLKYLSLDSNDLCKSFSDITFPASSKALVETSPTGFIDPRALIKAQLVLCKKNKSVTVPDVVNKIFYQKDHIEISTSNNGIYKAKKVLLCTGAFINCFDLIEKKLGVTLKSETTLWTKVSKDEALRLFYLPSLLYEIDEPGYKNVYLIQPVLYPDGNYYLKMGCNLPDDLYFNNLKDIKQWFVNGNSDAHLPVLKNLLFSIIPSLHASEFFTRRCIVSYTTHGKPYIGALNDKGLYVAAVGNGYSAMCSDALGRIAAHLVINDSFPPEYNSIVFQPVFQ